MIYCLALETSGGEYSGGFRLTARTARPPANDNFADAIPITLGTTTSGTTRDASLERDEPFDSDRPFTVRFRLTLTETTTVRLEVCTNRKWDLYVYAGAQVNQLTLLAYLDGLGCSQEGTLEPGVYSIQARSPSEGRFTLRAALAPPP